MNIRHRYLILNTYISAGAAGVGAPGAFLRAYVIGVAVGYLLVCGLDAWRNRTQRLRESGVIPPEVLKQCRDAWQSLDFKQPPRPGMSVPPPKDPPRP